jgi:uncharacterized membrane protein required for colicin V production
MFDAIVIVWVLANMYLGFRHGLFRRIVHVLAFYLGMLLAQALSVGFSQLLNLNTGNNPVSAHFVLFVGIVLAVVLFAEILGYAYGSALRSFSGLLFDRFFGLALGLAAGALEMAVLLFLFNQMFATDGPTGTAQLAVMTLLHDAITGSPTAHLLDNLMPLAKFVYAPVLPPKPETYFTKTFV